MKELTDNKSLIIGASSQLSRYMSPNIVRVSARNIPNFVWENVWENVYILFAEQRTSFSKMEYYKSDFYDVNYALTKQIFEKISCQNFVFLSTTELWNQCSGSISIETPFNFSQNYYTDSKLKITNYLLSEGDKVKIFYPFNFNSKFRKDTFLYKKIYESILNKKKISVGNLDFSREIMHAKFVANQIEINKKSDIIGTGNIINIEKFFKDLYTLKRLDFEFFVEFDTGGF